LAGPAAFSRVRDWVIPDLWVPFAPRWRPSPESGDPTEPGRSRARTHDTGPIAAMHTTFSVPVANACGMARPAYERGATHAQAVMSFFTDSSGECNRVFLRRFSRLLLESP